MIILLTMMIILLNPDAIHRSVLANNQFQGCSTLFNCGNIRNIGYPFYGDNRPESCGAQGFHLDCFDNQKPVIWIDNLQYYVLGIDQFVHKIILARRDLFTNTCPTWLQNTTLTKFGNLDREVRNLNIFYGCTSEVTGKVQIKSNVTCSVNGGGNGVFFAHEFVSGVGGCDFSIVVPVRSTAYDDLWDGRISLQSAISEGFEVDYNAGLASCSTCERSGGRCGSDSADNFVCFCPDQSYSSQCSYPGKNRPWKLIIAIGLPGIGILTYLVVWYCTYTRKVGDYLKLEAIFEKSGSLPPRRYRYSEVKKMTSSFKDSLGRGGYGDVYKGYLSNGLPVAVKLLKATKGNGDEFVNEVASVSRTSHVNVVSLLGYCLDGQKRALIYEYMPNGSLEKYINRQSDLQIGLEGLYKIAIGVARGLEYLHGGCNTGILHFDIKPHNILLDEDFCPKISDFGLAKLWNRKESLVSILELRGTIGYIAPEVFSKSFGVVSHKSDVYSYGMMVLEMVGARNRSTDVGISDDSETFLPHWVYQHVTGNRDLNLQEDSMEKEEETERKMLVVGLWCIQTNPLHRPSMKKVIEMLEGNLECLEIPPKPFLYCPSEAERASLVASILASKTTFSSPSISAVGSKSGTLQGSFH